MIVHPAVAWLTARQLLTRRRALPVLALVAVPIAIAIAFALWASEQSPEIFYRASTTNLVMTVVIPLIGLLLGAGAFGSELEDGTVAFVLARPIPRHAILLGKAAVAAPVAASASAVAAVVPALVIGGVSTEGLVLGASLASAAGGALYTVLFIAFGLLTRRGIILGLVYIALWEGSLGSYLPGTRTFSIRQYMLTITDWMTTSPEAFRSFVPLATALWMSAIIAAAALALAHRRLRGFEVASAE